VGKLAFYNDKVSIGRSELSPAVQVDSYCAMPACPLCAEKDHVFFVFKRNENEVYSCKRCGLEFLFPQPTDEALSAIYSDTYFLGEKDSNSLRRRALLKTATARLYLDTILPFVQVPKPRLLEIGCGSGDFLIEARARGFEVEGLEYSEHAASDANARLGQAVVRVGSPEDECLPSNAYDVIGAFDVIEHLRRPSQTLKHLYAALKPQGLLALATPSLDSWSRRVLGRYWMEYKTEHLTYFSRRSLTRLLEDHGFEVVQFFPNYKVLSADYVSAHFARFRVPLVSPVVQLLRNLLPGKLAHRPIRVVASGIMALAWRKP